MRKYKYEIISDDKGAFCLIRESKNLFGKIKVEFHYNNIYGGPWWEKETSSHQWACWRESIETLEAFKKRYEYKPTSESRDKV